MSLRIFILSMFFSISLLSQKQDISAFIQDFGMPDFEEQLHRPKNVFFNTQNDLTSQAEKLVNLPKGFSLEFIKNFESLSQHHYRFNVTYKGKRLFLGNVHVAVLKTTNQVQFYNKVNLPALAPLNQDDVAVPTGAVGHFEKVELQEQIYFPVNGVLTPAVLLEISDNQNNYVERIYSNNTLLYQRDLHLYHHASGVNDTDVQAYVFDPDPLTTAQTVYGSNYVDSNDAPVIVLDAERKLKGVVLTKDGAGLKLENDACILSDHGAPFSGITSGNLTNYQFSRSEQGFEDMMVLYHILQQYTHLHRLGFSAYPGYQIEVDPHGANGADNSFFSPGTLRLEFGEGGVDDAEDADVIIHEYNHAIQFSFTGVSPGSTERRTIEEALADYFTVSYSRAVNPFNSDKIFAWDGHNQFWPGREGQTAKNYKNINFSGGFYTHTDIMVAALSEILDSLGRFTTDQLVWEAMFSLNVNTTMPQFAIMVLLADENLNGGANYTSVRQAFVNYGILDVDFSLDEEDILETKLYAMDNFSTGGNALFEMEFDGNLVLYDVTGKKLKELPYNAYEILEIPSTGLTSGVYLLNVTTKSKKQATLKLLKF